MADVRCPMCGKPNPAEAEICRHCKARIKPLTPSAGNSSPTQPVAASQNSEEATDWLRGLLDSSSAPEESSPVEPAPPTEDPADWLSRIRQRSQEEQDALSKIGPKPQVDGTNAGENDWLNDLSEPESSTASGGSDVSAWLASLRDSDEPKPAAPPPASPPKQSPTAGSASKLEKDDDEWLRSLTTRIQASQSLEDQVSRTSKKQPENISQQPPVEPAAAAEDLPDWLRDLEQPETPSRIEAPAAAAPSSAEQPEGLPDWLKALQPNVESPVETTSHSADENLPDWLHDFQEPVAEEPAPQEPEPTQAANFPTWMNDLQIEEPPAEPAQPASAAAPMGELPDWMRDFQVETPQPPSAAFESSQGALPAEDLPDWMRDFQAETPAVAAVGPISALPSAEQPATPAENLPDWLSEMQGAPPVPVAVQPKQELPDWMNDFNAPKLPGTFPAVEASAPGMPSAEAEPASTDSSSAEWLNNFGAPTEEPPAALAAEEVPDWLRESRFALPKGSQTGAQAEEPVDAAPEEPTIVPAQIPDWLREFHNISTTDAAGLASADISPQPLEASQVPESPAAVPAEETPDWLRDFGAAPADAPASDWLSSLNETPNTATPGTTAALEGFSADEALPAAEIPEWLKSAASTESQARMMEPTSYETNRQGPVFGEEDLPDWMKSGQPVESGTGAPLMPADKRSSSESTPPFASREMNEMLQGVSPEEHEGGRTSAEGESETLEPAQLPTWLQAMRPVESAVSLSAGIDEQRVERSGPLAGLRGVLPGEELVANYRKPPVYTNKLQVSEKQHLNSVLLERILYDETQAQSLPGEPTRASQMITRILVAILLLVLVIIPGLTGFKLTVPAALPATQPGIGAMYKSINDLQPGANVLVAADFEAGVNGEMKSAAQAVLLHLKQRQPQVILTSTVPIGPLLGDMLLKDAKINAVANLGYLAGGSNALRRLSVHASASLPDPLQQIVPYPYRRGWKDEMMQGIKDLNSFQRILVLTDSVENARAWVEQVQPTLGPQTQLIMISSAQAAPLLRAYLESKQVQGLVSGLLGGAAYEQLMRQPGLAATSWTSYQLTLAAVIVLIAAGALAAGISNLIRRGKSKRKA